MYSNVLYTVDLIHLDFSRLLKMHWQWGGISPEVSPSFGHLLPLQSSPNFTWHISHILHTHLQIFRWFHPMVHELPYPVILQKAPYYSPLQHLSCTKCHKKALRELSFDHVLSFRSFGSLWSAILCALLYVHTELQNFYLKSAVLAPNWMDLDHFWNNSPNIEWNDLKLKSQIVTYYYYRWKQSPGYLDNSVELGEEKILVMWPGWKGLGLGWKFEGVPQIVGGYGLQKIKVIWGVEVPKLGGEIDGNLERSGVSNIGVITLKFWGWSWMHQ